jgi:hypothetical protein
MSPNAFIGKSSPPSEADLAAALGSAKPAWDQLLAELSQELALTSDWHSYSPKAGWALRLKRGDRNIVYLSPGRGRFLASFALGDKAVQTARASKLPKRVIAIIDTAKRYAEGTAVRLEVTGPKDIPAITRLAAIKLDH